MQGPFPASFPAFSPILTRGTHAQPLQIVRFSDYNILDPACRPLLKQVPNLVACWGFCLRGAESREEGGWPPDQDAETACELGSLPSAWVTDKVRVVAISHSTNIQ